jgi:hypothetical protein
MCRLRGSALTIRDLVVGYRGIGGHLRMGITLRVNEPKGLAASTSMACQDGSISVGHQTILSDHNTVKVGISVWKSSENFATDNYLFGL